MLKNPIINVYTDGSCHSQHLLGAWASIIFIGEEKTIKTGEESDTTHNRMELLAVINAIEHLKEINLTANVINIYSDSQYVVNLMQRKEKLKKKQFITNKGTPVQNIDLVQRLLNQIELYNLNFIKVKAHQKGGDINNREVDLIVRQLVRKAVIKRHGN